MTMTDLTAGTAAQQMGQQLHGARTAAGLSVAAVAERLKMQRCLIQALEAGDWSRLGAPVFVRGHLRSYARLLGIELARLDEVAVMTPVPVVPMVRTGYGARVFGRLGTRLVYALITVLVGVPVWMAAHRHLSAPDEMQTRAVALEIPEVHSPSPALGTDNASPTTSASFASAPSPAPETPPRPLTAMASLLPAAVPESGRAEISLHFSEDSWVELYAPDGRSLEQTLLKAGEMRRFARGQLGRVVIGNVQGATLHIDGEIQDLSAWKRANVARFAVSSAGVIGPVSD